MASDSVAKLLSAVRALDAMLGSSVLDAFAFGNFFIR